MQVFSPLILILLEKILDGQRLGATLRNSLSNDADEQCASSLFLIYRREFDDQGSLLIHNYLVGKHLNQDLSGV